MGISDLMDYIFSYIIYNIYIIWGLRIVSEDPTTIYL